MIPEVWMLVLKDLSMLHVHEFLKVHFQVCISFPEICEGWKYKNQETTDPVSPHKNVFDSELMSNSGLEHGVSEVGVLHKD